MLARIGRASTLTVFRGVALAVHGLASIPKTLDVTQTGISALPQSVQSVVLTALTSSCILKRTLRPLLLLEDLPARNAWENAIGLQPEEDDWMDLRDAVICILDPQSEAATDSRWVRVLVKVVAGELVLPSQELVEELKDYPLRGDLHKVRPMIRATEGALSAATGLASSGWAEAFWQQCWRDTQCEPWGHSKTETMNASSVGTTVETIREVQRRLVEHSMTTATSTGLDAQHDSSFGMAAYSLSILGELVLFGNSSSILGRMGLRSLLEVYLTIAYLTAQRDPHKWQEYRTYGVGQAKLTFLKLDESVSPPPFANLETIEAFANEDMWHEFVPINLGHWDNSNLRNISIEANLKDIYDRYYPWTSGFVHGSWAAARASCFQMCANPLHRLHRILTRSANTLEDVVEDACSLTDEILGVIDQLYPGFPFRVSITSQPSL
ncbi:DUF5677 domain-containing protein [Sulfobacillus sp. hq2]|uniref:DUF5677 domain-containing protein n=1 Tax=Sulfobacillus TaxID=28033 RepID=UPI0011AEF66D|nr:DUF5677 domain-containing protein [Sulfobacillus sp. hq2]